MAVVSWVPLLYTVVVSLLEPRFLVKKPFWMPTRAGTWVMLASNPSRSVTGALPEPELLDPDAVGELDDDEKHPARKRAPATTVPTVAPISLRSPH